MPVCYVQMREKGVREGGGRGGEGERPAGLTTRAIKGLVGGNTDWTVAA